MKKFSGALISVYCAILPADSVSPSMAVRSPSTEPVVVDSGNWNWNGPLGKLGVTSFTSNTSTITVAEARCPGVLVAKTLNLYSSINSLSSGRRTEICPLCESIEKGNSSALPLSSSK